MNYSITLQLLHMKPTTENGRPRSLLLREQNLKAVKTEATTTPDDLLSRSSIPRSSFAVRVSNKQEQGWRCSGNDPFAELQIQQVIDRQSNHNNPRKEPPRRYFDPSLLKQAYETCRLICAERSTTYYFGSLLMSEEKKKAVWAVYAWGQRTDELVDGANTNLEGSAAALDSWEKRLEDIFDGRPHDIADTALAHTFQRFPLDIKPFKDLIQGMRMDTWKTRYNNYQELELYCYYVAATGCLMAIPIAGISPQFVSSTQSIYEAAIPLGIGNQLTNILRDVQEDASRGRVYLPQDELRKFGLTDDDIFSRNVTDNWREFTKMQIARARQMYSIGEQVAAKLDPDSRLPVWASIMLYRKILDKIEDNNYDNLTKRARVGTVEKFLTLPLAYSKAMGWSSGTGSTPQ